MVRVASVVVPGELGKPPPLAREFLQAGNGTERLAWPPALGDRVADQRPGQEAACLAVAKRRWK